MLCVLSPRSLSSFLLFNLPLSIFQAQLASFSLFLSFLSFPVSIPLRQFLRQIFCIRPKKIMTSPAEKALPLCCSPLLSLKTLTEIENSLRVLLRHDKRNLVSFNLQRKLRHVLKAFLLCRFLDRFGRW